MENEYTKGLALASKIVDERGNRADKFEPPEPIDAKIALDVYSLDNPYSVINMTSGPLRYALANISDDLKDMTYEELRKLVKPDAILNQIRLRFWNAYDTAVIGGSKTINYSVLSKGLVDIHKFKRYLRKKENMAYILCPIADYEIQVSDLLETSLYKLRQGLEDIEVTNTKDLTAILRVYEVFDKRINGDYTQKVHKKVDVKTSNADGPKKTKWNSIEDVQNYIETNIPDALGPEIKEILEAEITGDNDGD